MKKNFRLMGIGIVLMATLCMLFTGVSFAAEGPGVTKKLTITEGKSKNIEIRGKYLVSKSFTTTNEKIATVDKKGKVTARKEGKCKIKVLVKYKKTKSSKKTSEKELQCTVNVRKAEKDSEVISTKKSESKITEKEFVSQMADFSMKLFQSTTASGIKKGKNVLVSPESVMMALSMTANGAEGDTLAEFEKVLYGGKNVEDFNPYLSDYNEKLEKSKEAKFHNANSIWIKDTITAKEDFLNTNRIYYNAEVFPSSFDMATVGKINNWVKTNTDGMIDKLLDEIPDRVVMYLINAIAFEGKWEEAYEEYEILEDKIFTDSQGKEQKATMLYSEEKQYIKDKDGVGFVKPYKGGEYAFMALLPDEKISVADYVANLSGEKFLELYEKRMTKTVKTKIPEFSYEYSKELKNALTAMGIKKAFSFEEGDFSKMAVLKEGRKLYINRVLHKTFIELDRNGTKAAAVTSVEMKCNGAAPSMEKIPEVYLDRPFVYGIINTDTGLPIFIGVVNRIP